MTTSEALLSEGRAESGAEADLEQPATWRQLRRDLVHSKKGLIGAVLVGIVIFVSIAAPLIAPFGPNDQEFTLVNSGPSPSHPLGNDELGRDVLSRTLYGTRNSVALAALVVLISAVIGTVLGALAGFLGGPAEFVIMRTTDFLLVFPWLLLAILLVTVIGPGFLSILVALCAVFWLSYSRVVRAETLRLRELEFVQASRAVGASTMRIVFGHVLPNIVHTVIVLATLDLGTVIIAGAALTFLGLGFQPPTATWGGMIAEGQAYLADSPWIALAPGAALVLTVIAINLLGDWLRDAYDPTLRIR